MNRTRINPRLAKIHHSYTVPETSDLLGVHPHTVRAWIKGGLGVLSSERPILILGKDLRHFLKVRRTAAKRPCPPGTMYCFKCRSPQCPALDMVDYQRHTDVSGSLRALCAICGTLMFRRCRYTNIGMAMPNIQVVLKEGPMRIGQLSTPLLNAD
jgi:hypothetical protein